MIKDYKEKGIKVPSSEDNLSDEEYFPEFKYTKDSHPLTFKSKIV